MPIILSAALGLAAVASQPSGPVYLECKINQAGNVYDWQIALDEVRGVAQFSSTVNNGAAGVQSRPAIFMANEIIFLGFHLNRTTLEIQRDDTDLLGNPEHEFGQCAKAKMQNRAI